MFSPATLEFLARGRVGTIGPGSPLGDMVREWGGSGLAVRLPAADVWKYGQCEVYIDAGDAHSAAGGAGGVSIAAAKDSWAGCAVMIRLDLIAADQTGPAAAIVKELRGVREADLAALGFAVDEQVGTRGERTLVRRGSACVVSVSFVAGAAAAAVARA